MANEAVIIELLGNGGDPIRYTVADGTGIEKGSLMYISGDRTISVTRGENEKFIGIAAAEKVANDGSTNLAVYTNGIFDLKDSGSGITRGVMVKVGGVNTIAASADGDFELGKIVGKALETASADEVIAVRVLV